MYIAHISEFEESVPGPLFDAPLQGAGKSASRDLSKLSDMFQLAAARCAVQYNVHYTGLELLGLGKRGWLGL